MLASRLPMRLRLHMALLTLSFALPLVGCGEKDDAPPPALSARWEQPGQYPVGHAVFSLEDGARERTLLVHVWYPAEEGSESAAEALSIEQLIPEGEDRETLATLVAAAPEACTRRATRSIADAPPSGTSPFPLVTFSHCHGCLGLSSFGIAERLASHGFAVVAPDHTGDTLFESLRGTKAPLDGDFLAVRSGDVRFVLDTLLDAESPLVPAPLRGRFDPERVGAFGHSYGAATTGLVLQEDARTKAGLAIAAPMQSPVLRGPDMAKIDRPVAFLLAREDNSIAEIGNSLIRSNFQAAKQAAWLFEIADAGHWSFSDICALTDSFRAGCGEGNRQQDGDAFTYLDNEVARGIGASYVTAFMAAELRGEMEARDYLREARPEAFVTTDSR